MDYFIRSCRTTSQVGPEKIPAMFLFLSHPLMCSLRGEDHSLGEMETFCCYNSHTNSLDSSFYAPTLTIRVTLLNVTSTFEFKVKFLTLQPVNSETPVLRSTVLVVNKKLRVCGVTKLFILNRQ